MNKNVLIVTIIIFLGIGLGLGYFIANNQAETEMAKITALPRSSLIEGWLTGIVGEVGAVTAESITILSSDGDITLIIPDNVEIEKLTITLDEEMEPEVEKNLSFEDIKQGDNVYVSISADVNGILEADVITIANEFVVEETQ